MDESLRLLERRALLGDERALRALERERIRLGRGWHDEPLPPGLRTAGGRGLYLWTPPKGHSIELVHVQYSGVWMSRRPIPALHFRTFSKDGVRARRGPAVVTFEAAESYAKWAGVKIARALEWRAAGDEKLLEAQGTAEWVRDSRGEVAVTPPVPDWHPRFPRVAAFRVVVRGES